MHFHCATIKVKITFEWSIEKNSPQDIESQTINCPSMHVILLGLFDIFYYVSRLTRTISFLAGLPLLNRNMVPVQSEVKFTVNCVTFLQTFPQLLFIHTKLKKLLWWVQWHHWINIITFLWIFFFSSIDNHSFVVLFVVTVAPKTTLLLSLFKVSLCFSYCSQICWMHFADTFIWLYF